MDKVQVSRAVARLLKARRVVRSSDGTDGRVTRLSLSPRGKAIYDQIVPLALNLERRFLDVLSGNERETLDRLMTKLAHHAKGFAHPQFFSPAERREEN